MRARSNVNIPKRQRTPNISGRSRRVEGVVCGIVDQERMRRPFQLSEGFRSKIASLHRQDDVWMILPGSIKHYVIKGRDPTGQMPSHALQKRRPGLSIPPTKGGGLIDKAYVISQTQQGPVIDAAQVGRRSFTDQQYPHTSRLELAVKIREY